MHILGLVAENVKRIRVVEIVPKGRVIQITGKNGQGKTSVIDAIYYALVGKKALPDKPVRKGAEKARIRLDLGELIVTRIIGANGSNSLQVESAAGAKFTSPQQVLDELLGLLAFDPLEFVGMKKKEQVEALRKIVKLEIDVEAINTANREDFEERRNVNRDIERLRGQMVDITVQEGLPKERQDDKPILLAMEKAGEVNAEAQKQGEKRQAMQNAIAAKRTAAFGKGQEEKAASAEAEELEKRLTAVRKKSAQLKLELVAMASEAEQMQKELDAMPAPEFADVSALTAELQKVQLTNREIDKRDRRAVLEKELAAKVREAGTLTRAMEDREESKRSALATAKMPITGLSFDEEGVLLNGIPLDQLGEAEQIKVSVSIAMAANPKLRVLRIMHGEALDDDSMKVLEEMAEANDFQIWMAKVDSTGKVGIVMEDGSVKETEDSL
jgi:hypothetical protein